jgi:hypothetical protein
MGAHIRRYLTGLNRPLLGHEWVLFSCGWLLGQMFGIMGTALFLKLVGN